MDNRKDSLLEALKSYSHSDAYPFHMPGHKRQIKAGLELFPNPFEMDITEIDGFDNLHHPKECLKISMEYAAQIYGTDRTYYLINGSTGGILSAISGSTQFGGKILLARNSHKSAYHAVMLRHLKPVYIEPELIGEFQIQGGIDPIKLQEKLEEDPEIQAVFITSPTYEGIVSDIGRIAEIVHAHGIPLIVDEAHGAHFSFGNGFPKAAVKCGADVVIQSLHKTLPALTQTAVLHIRGEYVNRRLIEKYLQVYQTSSPSYVFLSSIEHCISYMGQYGMEELDGFSKRLRKWMECTEHLKCLCLLTDSVIGKNGVKDRDASKILVSAKNTSLTGTELAQILREKYHLEAEMSCSEYVLLMTSFMDSEDGFKRLFHALEEVDRMLASDSFSLERETIQEAKECEKKDMKDGKKRRTLTWIQNVEKKMEPFEAEAADGEMVLLSESAGRISGGFVTVYPPGVPALVPGECISLQAVKMISENISLGLTVEGITEDRRVYVVENVRE